MKTSAVLSAVALALTMTVCTQAARADTRDATCEVRKDGDKQKGKSGPCTFGQRQGYIDIDLKNGDTVALRPADNANHFKDQHGNKVVRTQSGGSTQTFKWENGKHINVTLYAPTHDGAPPQVMVGTNGEGEVIFKNNCVVYYDKHGRRTSSLPACSSKQVNHAADAMASYRREQGMN